MNNETKNIVPSSQSRCLMLKIRTQIREGRLNAESTAEPFYAKLQLRIIRKYIEYASFV